MVEIVALKDMLKCELECVSKTPFSIKKRYELHAGKEIVGVLQHDELFGNLAHSETKYGKWSFDIEGVLESRIVMKEGNEIIAVQAKVSDDDGIIEFRNGRNYKWRHSKVTNDFSFSDKEKEIVRFSKNNGIITRLRIAIKENIEQKELMQLISFAWYILTINEKNR
ncbi:MAG: hypothetical protein QXT63_01890 [Thermoplasmata archaeon]